MSRLVLNSSKGKVDMRCIRFGTIVVLLAMTISLGGELRGAKAQNPVAVNTSETGYAVKKPVFGGACAGCPWGAMAELVKEMLQPSGWDVQICYVCAGGPREARMVAGAAMAGPTPRNPGLAPPEPGAGVNEALPPKGPVDFGVTSVEYLESIYLGINDYAKDPGKPQKQLRLIANIQEPTYFVVAVKKDSGINSLSDIVEKRLPVKLFAKTGVGGLITPTVLDYYGITKEKLQSFGGTYSGRYSRNEDFDVFIGWGSLTDAPEYNDWYQSTQKYDLKYLEIAPELRQKLIEQFHLKEGKIPFNLFRGMTQPVTTVLRNGEAIYGRTDMPDDLAYTLAKVLDEHQEMLQWANSGMNWSYNWRTVWKAMDVPLHPGAEKYYREVGYIK